MHGTEIGLNRTTIQKAVAVSKAGQDKVPDYSSGHRSGVKGTF